jgi:hypothetical protein
VKACLIHNALLNAPAIDIVLNAPAAGLPRQAALEAARWALAGPLPAKTELFL